MNGYFELANAIILQAVKDYRDLWTVLSANPNDRKAKRELKKIEEFFHSTYFTTLTDLDGKKLLEDIQDELERNGVKA